MHAGILPQTTERVFPTYSQVGEFGIQYALARWSRDKI